MKRTYLDGLLRVASRTNKVLRGEHVQRALTLLELAEFDEDHGTDMFDQELARGLGMNTITWTTWSAVA